MPRLTLLDEIFKNQILYLWEEQLKKPWQADYVDIPSPKGRKLGQQDLTDIPTDEDIRKIMPLPWFCKKCGNGMLMYTFNCRRCGHSTPLGEINWRQ